MRNISDEIKNDYYQPCRLPIFSKSGRWIIATVLIFLLSAFIFHEFLEYNQFIPNEYYLSNHDQDNGLWLIPLGGSVPYVLYQWRYTAPDKLCSYMIDIQGNRHLRFAGHIFATILTVSLFTYCLMLLGMPF